MPDVLPRPLSAGPCSSRYSKNQTEIFAPLTYGQQTPPPGQGI